MRWARDLACVVYDGWSGYMGSAIIRVLFYVNIVGSTVSPYVCRNCVHVHIISTNIR